MSKLWDSECGPYNMTASGWLGSHRETMLNNPLLKRSTIGRTKSKCLRLPPNGYTYGYLVTSTGTARQALSGWTNCLSLSKYQPLKPIKQAAPIKDFKQINRSAVCQGVVEHGPQRTFAQSHTAKVLARSDMKDVSVKAGVTERPPALLPPPGHTHGIKSGTPEPIDPLLKHAHKDKWMRSTKARYLYLAKNMDKQVPGAAKKPNYKQWYPNRASMLRTFMPPIGVSAPPWRMPRFLKKAKPHLSTFRSEKEELATYQGNASDRVGHQGTAGQGILTKPVNRKAGMEVSKLEKGCYD